MRIVCVGGGPASLYLGILVRQALPDVEVAIHERNRADDTFGWGVVFSEETLDHFREADPVSYDEILRHFATWDDIDTWHRDTLVRSTGHGFCGLARGQMLQILQARCQELGVELHFESEVDDPQDLLEDADLLVGGDGVRSVVRDTWEDRFRPRIRWGSCRFSWLGTDRRLDAFTFIFRENEHGLFQVHAYPFQEDLSTFIVECDEATWRQAGLDEASEEETAAYVENLFSDHLDGHRILTNRSIWRRFPEVHCETWHHGRVVLLGDAAHTAHFSIGSGTKLAMEDAIALTASLKEHGPQEIPTALAAYEHARRVDVLKLQKAALTSQRWFEHARRYLGQDPVPFTFNLMTRSKRITYDNLARRDPELVRRAALHVAEATGTPREADGEPPAPMFTPLEVGSLRLANRVVVSPMCQYSATDGVPGSWHLVHLGARAVGGAGLVMTEMTNVSAEARITRGCTGLWNDEQEEGWRRIVDFVHEQGETRIGLQIGHAGRKASCHLPWEGDHPLRGDEAWPVLGPSPLPFDEGWPVPRAMDRADMDRVLEHYEATTRRAVAAGFDLVEVHMAHGYLLSSFISPACNERDDAYGGDLAGRMRFPLEVLDVVRAAWPAERPVAVRITANDWLPAGEGIEPAEAVEVARMLVEHGCDLLDVSSGGNTPDGEPLYGRMYQVPFAERIRYAVDVPVMAVGAIQGADHVNTIIAAERADLCALARPHLLDPHLTLRAAVRYRHRLPAWPRPYLVVQPPQREAEEA